MTEYNDWQIWNGGECPVEESVMGQVQRACETRYELSDEGAYELFNFDWSYDGVGGDIIAYRTVKEPEAVERTFYWDGERLQFWSEPETEPKAREAIITVKGDKVSARWAK